LAPEFNKPSFLFWDRNEEYFPQWNQNRGSGLALRRGSQFSVNAMFKTALAMSIVIVGAIVIYETFHQDSWLYDSGMAMAWGATVSWVRNLI
jgi:hypothetical protein